MHRLVTLVAAVTVAAGALVATASEASANFTGNETGYGATLQDAESAARNQMAQDYYGCDQATLVSASQLADGSWQASMAANCQGYN